LESLRKLDARDKQAKKPMEAQMAEASMWSAIRAEEQRKAAEDAKRAADIRRLEELTRKASVIPGEVVRAEIE
jgi:FixJ family two-component response regulator